MVGINKRIGWYVLIAIPLLAAVVFSSVRLPYLLGVAGFYLLPGLYLAHKTRRNTSASAVFALAASAPLALVVDYIGTASNLWHVPQSLFPRFLGLLPIEDYLWMACGTFTIVMAGEFVHPLAPGKVSKRKASAAVAAGIALCALFFALLAAYGTSFFVFHSPYLYLGLGVLFFGLPAAFLGAYLRRESFKYIPAIGYFLYLTFIFESVAAYNSWWEFNGAYFLPPLTVFGKTLPLEEMLFVGVVGACMAMWLYRFLFKPERS